jgi:ABC-type amino acid transport substrate-binding protein
MVDLLLWQKTEDNASKPTLNLKTLTPALWSNLMTKPENTFRSEKTSFSSCAIHACVVALATMLMPSAQAASTLDKIAQTGSITVGYRDLALPFSYQDANKRPIGYSIDICMKVIDALKRDLKRPDMTVKFVQVSSVSRLTELNDGIIDLECSSTAVTAERLKQVAFATPAFIAAIRTMVRENSGIKGIANLAGKTVVTTKGTSSEKVFNDLNQLRSLRAHLILAKDHGESFALLESGKADAFILDDVLLYSQRAFSKTPEKFTITRDALAHEPFAIMLRKDDVQFKKTVDAEITRLILNGEIKPIYRKWFESPIPPLQVNLQMPPSYMLNEFFKAPKDWQVY